jgi:hypothetical protein
VLVFGYEEESEMFLEVLLDHSLTPPPWDKEMRETRVQYKLRHKYSCSLELASEGSRP